MVGQKKDNEGSSGSATNANAVALPWDQFQ